MHFSPVVVVGSHSDSQSSHVVHGTFQGGAFLALFVAEGFAHVQIAKQMTEKLLHSAWDVDVREGVSCLQQEAQSISKYAVLVWRDDTQWCAVKEAVVWLQRGDKAGVLLQSEEPKMVRGLHSKNDVCCVVTDTFWQVSASHMGQPIQKVEETGELLRDVIGRYGNRADYAAAIVGKPHINSVAQVEVDQLPDEAEQEPNDVRVEEKEIQVSQKSESDELQAEREIANREMVEQKDVDELDVSDELRPKLQHESSTGLAGIFPCLKHVLSTKKGKGLLLLILLGIFCATVGVQWTAQQHKKEVLRVQQVVSPFQTRLDQIKTVSAVDVIAARSQTQQLIQDMSTQLQSLPKKDGSVAPLNKLEQEARAFLASIDGQKTVPALPELYNFELQQQGVKVQQMVVVDQMMYAVDPATSTLYTYALDTKRAQVKKAISLSYLTGVVATEKGVVLVGDGLEKKDKKVYAAPESWQKADLAMAFGNTIFALDKKDNYLRKLVAVDGNATQYGGGGTNWFTNSTETTSFSSLAIDGSVWFGTSTGEIQKFYQGKPQSWKANGVEPAFSSSLLIYTAPDMDKLYVLEPASKRLVLLKKNGERVSTITAEELGKATALFVSADQKTAYVAAGSLVYALNLE